MLAASGCAWVRSRYAPLQGEPRQLLLRDKRRRLRRQGLTPEPLSRFEKMVQPDRLGIREARGHGPLAPRRTFSTLTGGRRLPLYDYEDEIQGPPSTAPLTPHRPPIRHRRWPRVLFLVTALAGLLWWVQS